MQDADRREQAMQDADQLGHEETEALIAVQDAYRNRREQAMQDADRREQAMQDADQLGHEETEALIAVQYAYRNRREQAMQDADRREQAIQDTGHEAAEALIAQLQREQREYEQNRRERREYVLRKLSGWNNDADARCNAKTWRGLFFPDLCHSCGAPYSNVNATQCETCGELHPYRV